MTTNCTWILNYCNFKIKNLMPCQCPSMKVTKINPGSLFFFPRYFSSILEQVVLRSSTVVSSFTTWLLWLTESCWDS